ncbi:FCD domain-containing protein [Hydrogenophaga sp.]|uniref:FadR/GntR family transcriptional regulator n=1 Tax=Hydrogenophaga sp. TaxID=1904254 RepID=UPI00263664B1|nr:FCD domain-containing protein [Hydrogenophaga sp.]MCW5654733.1 FadR family transcriptional regulator [Hydrogenophaga sp.]
MRRTSTPPPTTLSDPVTTDADILAGLGLREVRSQRGFEAVCEQIRQQVARGELRTGDRLPGERDLAEQLAVSRSVVREAIRSLESMGVVESRMGAHGGIYIRASTSQGITQAMSDMVALAQMPIGQVTETRIELTCTAIRLACERATEADLDAIEADIEMHAELFRQGHGSRNARSMGHFYRLLAQATHNDLMVMLVDSVSEVMRMLLLRIDPRPHPDMIPVRRKVLRLIRARDAEGACEALRVHLQHLTAYLESESKTAPRVDTSSANAL